VAWRGRRDTRSDTPSPETEQPPSVPTIPGFGSLTIIGHGSTATVYKARQDGFDRDVAIKVLNVDISDRRAQKRFQRERSLNGRLSDHPNVVTVLDSGFIDGRYPYLAMEFFEQGSLADQLKQRGPFEVPLVLHIGVRIAGALETAHRLGVLHRDVKPHNILLSRFGEPALADFGIAAILEMEQSMTAALTPIHAAPELLEGADPTARTDVYALGSTLYTLLAGVAPFGGPPGEGMLSQLLRIATTDVPSLTRPDMPPGLSDLLKASMAKRPEDRIESAGAFGEALRDLQRGLPGSVSTLPVESLGLLEPISPDKPVVPPAVITPTAVTPLVIDPSFEDNFEDRFARETDDEDEDEDDDDFLLGLDDDEDDDDDNQEADEGPIPAAADSSGTLTFQSVTAPAARAVTQTTVTPPVTPPVISPTTTQTPGSQRLAKQPPVPVPSAHITSSEFDPDLTVSGRQLHPVQPDVLERRRRWPWVAAGAGTFLCGAVVTLALTGATPDPPRTTTTLFPGSTGVTASPAPTTIDYSVFSPTEISLSDKNGRVQVNFTDNTAGLRQHVVKVGRAGKPPVNGISKKGDSFVVLDEGVSLTDAMCVVVYAAINPGQEIVATAPPLCINGAEVEPTTARSTATTSP
jgi:serine/threonine protein kinase